MIRNAIEIQSLCSNTYFDYHTCLILKIQETNLSIKNERTIEVKHLI